MKPRRAPHPLALAAVVLMDAAALALFCVAVWLALTLAPALDAAVIAWRMTP